MSSGAAVAAGAAPPAPEAGRVLQGLRFGWAIAELRGRLGQGPPPAPPPARVEHALPLADERTWPEQTLETASVLEHLADELGINVPLETLSGQEGEGSAAAHLAVLRRRLGQARKEHDEDRVRIAWEDACKLFYAWDAKVQDTLAGESFAVASGYQLGRGLAEAFWALDTERTAPDLRSWEVLLGPARLDELSQLLTRLTAYFPAGVSVAVEASLTAWGEVAADPAVRARPQTYGQLHEQLRLWHDALLVGQTPEARLAPGDLLARARRIGPVLRAFVPEASVALVSLLLAGAAAGLFAVGGETPALAPVLAVVGAFGITSAGALAKAKDAAHSLFAQLRQAMNTDLLRQALTVPPATTYLDTGGDLVHRSRQRRALRKLRADESAFGGAELSSAQPGETAP